MNTNENDRPATTERKTTELCGDQARRGIRCIRPKHHEGDHECHLDVGDPIRWRST